ncbi:MAG: SRPBCC family protein [Chloroflexi bacterium]|nr:SRPBCC family protein [Chloroflexota bacterium]
MITLREQIEVAASPEEAFGFVSDFANLPRWDPSAVQATRSDDGALGVGSAFDIVVAFGGGEVPMRYAIEEYEPPRRVVLLGESERVRAVDTIEIEGAGPHTIVRYTATFQLRGMLRFASLLVRPRLRRLARSAMDGLERELGPVAETGERT